MKLLRLLVSLSLIFLLSCAKQKSIVLQEFSPVGIEDFLRKMQDYSSAEAILNLYYEGKGGTLNGDAILKIKKSELLLRVYYFGFPAGEIYEEKGQVTSTVFIEKEILKQIVTGVRKGIIWWQGDFSVDESSEEFILKENGRKVYIHKKDFTPIKQLLTIDDRNILITYGRNEKVYTEDGVLLNIPLSIQVNYKNRLLRIEIEKIKIQHG